MRISDWSSDVCSSDLDSKEHGIHGNIDIRPDTRCGRGLEPAGGAAHGLGAGYITRRAAAQDRSRSERTATQGFSRRGRAFFLTAVPRYALRADGYLQHPHPVHLVGPI